MDQLLLLVNQAKTWVGANPLEIGFAVAAVVLTVLIVKYQHRQAQSKLMPPLTPDTLWENAVRTGYVSLPHKVQCTEWVADNTSQDVSKGATFRLSMPIPYHFVVTADYALSRLILAGDADSRIKEADKSPGIKNINIYPSIDSILS